MSSLPSPWTALVHNEFDGLTFTCGDLPPDECPIHNGREALVSVGFKGAQIGLPLWIIAGMTLLFSVITVVGLQFRPQVTL